VPNVIRDKGGVERNSVGGPAITPNRPAPASSKGMTATSAVNASMISCSVFEFRRVAP
jgi:hypothetical protein